MKVSTTLTQRQKNTVLLETKENIFPIRSKSLFQKLAEMLARIFFYPTLGVNALISKVTNRHWYDRIDDTVILGALPLRSVTHKLIEEENVKAMVSMNEDYELKYFTYNKQELANLDIDYLQLSTTDLTGTPTQRNICRAIDFIMMHRKQGHSVYVHCKAGRTRSATVTACYLMQLHKWSPEKTLDFMKEKRPVVWLRSKQMKSVYKYFENNVKSR